MAEVDRGPGVVPFARHALLSLSDDVSADTRRLDEQLMSLLAEQPRALVCDLSAISEVTPALTAVLQAVARQQVHWPGTPVGVVCPDRRLLREVVKAVRPELLVVGASAEEVEPRLAEYRPAEHASTTLRPGLTAPRAARAFVARTCLGWQTLSVTGHACLITSELVTNAVLHAHTAVDLTVSRCSGRLRISVHDGGAVEPSPAWNMPTSGIITGSGRGLLLVSSVCRAWGVYPTSDGGKVIWAVLDTDEAV